MVLEISIFDQTIGPLDLYQGSRLLAKLTKLCSAHLRRTKKMLLPKAMTIPSDIQADAQTSKIEMHMSKSPVSTNTLWLSVRACTSMYEYVLVFTML